MPCGDDPSLAVYGADTLHKGDVFVFANVTSIDSLRQEPCMDQYYSRRIPQRLCDRVRNTWPSW